jgi:hypothetical protein
MLEARIALPIRLSITGLGFRTIEKQIIASIVFGLVAYFGAVYSTNPMTLTETSYEEAKVLIALKGCEEISFLSYHPYLKLRSESLSRRVSNETMHRLSKDGCRTVCGLDATTIALLPIGLLAGLGMFRFLIAAELALGDIRDGRYSAKRNYTFAERVHALHTAVFSAPIELFRQIKAWAAPLLITALIVGLTTFALMYAELPFYPAETSYEEAAKLVRADPNQKVWLQADAFPVLKSRKESIGRRISAETSEKLRAEGVGAVAVDGALSIAILIPLWVLVAISAASFLKHLDDRKKTQSL